jgi:hypothetical protein
VSAPRWNTIINPANDPAPKSDASPISATNAVPVDSMGSFDGRLVETPEEGERARQLQAPNRATTWAKSQQPREKAMTGPRFEQTIIEVQVRCDLSPLSGSKGIGDFRISRNEGTGSGSDADRMTSASTLRRHRTYPQAARALDKEQDRRL